MIIFYRALATVIRLIEFLIIIRIFLSVLNVNIGSPIGRLVYELTEPILSPARNIISKLGLNTGMFDFSPLLAILLMRIFYDIIGKIIF